MLKYYKLYLATHNDIYVNVFQVKLGFQKQNVKLQNSLISHNMLCSAGYVFLSKLSLPKPLFGPFTCHHDRGGP